LVLIYQHDFLILVLQKKTNKQIKNLINLF
jgi:hypothetical protein